MIRGSTVSALFRVFNAQTRQGVWAKELPIATLCLNAVESSAAVLVEPTNSVGLYKYTLTCPLDAQLGAVAQVVVNIKTNLNDDLLIHQMGVVVDDPERPGGKLDKTMRHAQSADEQTT